MSRVIFKLTFKHPNFKDTTSKNVAHVNYIATRSGVDKSLTESDLEKELQKGIEISQDDDYIKYIDERPRSHGLFGKSGVEDLKSVQEEVNNVDSFVWRGIISLREEDATHLGYTDKDKWQLLLRNKVPDMALEMDIRLDNLRWVGAVHMEKGHPHAHIMFWEKQHERTLGTIRKDTLKNIRKLYTDEVFEDERILLENEKNAIRDLIRDFAKDDISQASRIISEINEVGKELEYIHEDHPLGVSPKLYSRDEKYLTDRLLKLSQIMPMKGRVNLKFMPGEVKVEVRDIADYLLQKPSYSTSLEINLKAIEELTRMYTGNDNDIQKARDKAYNDIRDRISQVILKGAVQCQKRNTIYINSDLAEIAVSTIENMSNQINLQSERDQVFRKLSLALSMVNLSDEQVSSILKSISEKEDLNYSLPGIKSIIASSKMDTDDLNMLSPSQKSDFYLAALKSAGFQEEISFDMLRNALKKESSMLENRLKALSEDGYLNLIGDSYKLSQKGIDELLKFKPLDQVQKEIMAVLEKEPVNFETLISNKVIFGSLTNKDPDEFEISRFDLKVKEYFGDENKITIKELENKIFSKNNNLNTAEKDFDIMKKRIEKLFINGCLVFNKETGMYSFTEESLAKLKDIPWKMVFSKYDAGVTLGYIDKAPDGILTKDFLMELVYKEIENSQAKELFENFTDIAEQYEVEGFYHNKYIQFENDNIFRATPYGVSLMQGEVDNPTPEMIDALKLLQQISASGGALHKDNLKEVLEKNIHNIDARNHFEYMVKRLDYLKKNSYLIGDGNQYSITSTGKNKRLELLEPEREFLRKELKYLAKLGLIKMTEENIKPTDKYFSYMKSIALAKDNNIERSNQAFGKDICQLIDKSLDNLNLRKHQNLQLRSVNKKYLNFEFNDIKTDYHNIRACFGIKDITEKTIINLSTTLLAAGKTIDETREILYSWNIKGQANISDEQMNQAIEKADKYVKEQLLWGKTPVVNFRDREEMFKVLGIKDPPVWMYAKQFSKGFGFTSLVSEIWKSVWYQLDNQRKMAELQADRSKKQFAKQAGTDSKEAKKEISRKIKDRGSLAHDDDFEL